MRRRSLPACVLEVDDCALLVKDLCTCQKLLVHTDDACCFCEGDRVCVRYGGIMTMSIPPQITACSVQKVSC